MERIKVADAAKLLGVSEQYIRIGLQRKILPIGSCVMMSSRWTYHISPDRLYAYLGKKEPPVTATTDGSTAE